MPNARIVVLIEKDRVQDLEEIESKLGILGVKIDQVLKNVGLISVIGEIDQLREIQNIDGVEHVRLEGTISHPPMDESKPQ